MKIVAVDGRPLAPEGEAWAGLEKYGEFHYYDLSSEDEILERAKDAEVVLTNKAQLREPLLKKLDKLRFIAVTATGYDCVDAAAARQQGITVSNVPIYSTDSVAQFVFALVLELCHHVGLHSRSVHGGEWANQPDFSIRKTPLIELAGKTLGIVGYGRIGRKVAEIARAMGMKVVAHSRTRKSDPDDPVTWLSIDELFGQSDVISLHCPLTPQTKEMINRDLLRKIRPSAFLINTARGALINEKDLADALNAGTLAGAAVDVVTREPILGENPLLKAKNCIITPHIAWATEEARDRLMKATVENVAAYAAGKPINVVN